MLGELGTKKKIQIRKIKRRTKEQKNENYNRNIGY